MPPNLTMFTSPEFVVAADVALEKHHSDKATKSFASFPKLGSSITVPTLRDLELSLRELKNRAATVHDRLRFDDTEEKNANLLVVACDAALRETYPILEDVAHYLIREMQVSSAAHSVDGIGSASSNVWHATLAQSRAHAFLDTLEKVLDLSQCVNSKMGKTRSDYTKSVQLMNRINSVMHAVIRLRDSKKFEQKKTVKVAPLSVSPWMLPRLSFDVIVGGPTLFEAHACGDKMLSDRKACSRHGICTTPVEIPIILEARAVYQILEEDNGNALSMDSAVRPCAVEVLKCKHMRRMARGSECYSAFTTGGDVALVLSIKPVETWGSKISESYRRNIEFKGLAVHMARIVQTNAVPPHQTVSVDMYTSSNKGKDEVTISLRFQTSLNGSDDLAKLLVDVVVS